MKRLNQTLLLQALKAHSLESPLMIVLIGAPGTGKSTFIKELQEYISVTVASTDDQIDAYAAKHGLTYSQAFAKINFKTLKRQMEADIIGAVRGNKHVVIDQTNMHRKSRKDKLAMSSVAYQKVAVVFEVETKLLLERLKKREAETGKGIPVHVVFSMLKAYEAPTREEGFSACYELTQ